MRNSSTLRKVKNNKHFVFYLAFNMYQFALSSQHLPRPEKCFENTVVATTKVEKTKNQRIVDIITMLDFAAIEQV